MGTPANAAGVVLVAAGVKKTYAAAAEPVIALDDVSVTIRAGEFVAVTGPSGSGKTTLLNCLSGLDSFDTGSVTVDGVDLAAADDAARTELRRTAMGFVFQAPNLLPVFSAVDNVALPLIFDGRSRRDAHDAALHALDAVGLAHRAGHKPAQLSGGEQQRVAIARAFVRTPRIVWADEPTGNLDSAAAEVVMDLLQGLREGGTTTVLVTHDQGLAARTDRRVDMRDGRIVDEHGR